MRSTNSLHGENTGTYQSNVVASTVARRRFYAILLSVFASVDAVIQRTQEIGIRMALGAQRAQVLTLVLRQGVMLTTIGVGMRLVSAAASTRFLQSMLFGIAALDPTTLC